LLLIIRGQGLVKKKGFTPNQIYGKFYLTNKSLHMKKNSGYLSKVRCKFGSGFTIIELVVTITVLAAMGWMGVSAMLSGVDAWTDFNYKKDLLTDARMAVDRMAREIRMVKDLTAIITAGPQQLSFTDTNGKVISFTLDSGMIERSEDSVTNGLLANVTDLSFTYYDSSDSVIAEPVIRPSETDMRRVKIAVSLAKASGRTVNLQTDVWPRNLK